MFFRNCLLPILTFTLEVNCLKTKIQNKFKNTQFIEYITKYIYIILSNNIFVTAYIVLF